MVSIARADDQKQILEVYEQLGKALRTRQPNLLLNVDAPDFRARSYDEPWIDGTTLARQMKEEAANAITVNKVSVKLTRVAVFGGAAAAPAALTYGFDTIGKNG